MRNPIIALQNQRDARGQHAGLLLQRYLCENSSEEGGIAEKQSLLKAAINAARNPDVRSLYKAAYDRWVSSLQGGGRCVELVADGRLIVGLGSDNVLEVGIRLHHNYGMPQIPGSALKGLAAHYCDRVYGQRDSEERDAEAIRFRSARKRNRETNEPATPSGDYHTLLFGTTEDSGCIVFHDAWIVPDSSGDSLVLDVMTPHHSGWNDLLNPTAPTDFDAPVPVPFLSATGSFRVAVSWCGPESGASTNWTHFALLLLTQALASWGIGGKTSSGYGRLISATSQMSQPQVTASTRSTEKRPFGYETKVRIIGDRKSGFDVQEDGRPQGTLTVGEKPPEAATEVGVIVDVQVHNDDPNKPQYRWPSTRSAKPVTGNKKRGT